MNQEPMKDCGYDAEEKITARLWEHDEEASIELRGLKVIEHTDFKIEGCYLHGSQNYGAQRPTSDIDSFLVVVPTYEALLRQKNLNFNLEISKKEKVTVKTVFEFLDYFWKGNIFYLEALLTPYKVGSDIISGLKDLESIKQLPTLGACSIWNFCLGNFHQKLKTMKKGPNTTEAFTVAFGYDRRDAAHAFRLGTILRKLNVFEGDIEAFSEVLQMKGEELQTYLSIKDGKFSLEEIEKLLDVMRFELLEMNNKKSFPKVEYAEHKKETIDFVVDHIRCCYN